MNFNNHNNVPLKLGIIGLGFVGGSIYKSFLANKLNVLGYDKYKNGGIGTLKSMLKCDIVFLCLPTPFDKDKNCYDISAINEVCNSLTDYSGLVVLKSTVEPKTTDKLVKKYKLNMIHNPEFLTARSAFKDFHTQHHVVLGKSCQYDRKLFNQLVELYRTYYTDNISITDSISTETMKLFANNFYAAKIIFFNEMYMLCQKMNINYENVRDLIIKNKWVCVDHTNVPGNDGLLGFNGYCFPKDTEALRAFLKHNNLPHALINSVIEENNNLRNIPHK